MICSDVNLIQFVALSLHGFLRPVIGCSRLGKVTNRGTVYFLVIEDGITRERSSFGKLIGVSNVNR